MGRPTAASTSPPTPTSSDRAARHWPSSRRGARPYELTDELETVGPSDFCGTLFGGYTAHPKRDPVTGELHAVSYNPIRGNIVQYTVTGVDGKVRRTVNIRLRAQTMMHDFSLTEKYVVLYDLPVALDFGTRLSSRPAKAVAGLLTRFAERHAAPDFFLRAAMRGSDRGGASPGGMPYRWAPERQARVGVLPREGTAADIRWFDVNACYVFHPLNAYDEADRIVLDVVRHPSVFTAGHSIVPGQPDAGSMDGRPDCPQGHRGATRRHGAGIPARRRATGRPAAPIRIRGRFLPWDDGHLSARRDPQTRRRHATHPVGRVRAGPRTRRVRLRPVQCRRRRRRRRGDGFRLRPVDRPQ